MDENKPQGETSTDSIVDQVSPVPHLKRGRPKDITRTEMLRTIHRDSFKVDKNWIIKQLLIIYKAKGIEPKDKLRALELIAKLSGLDNKQVPEGEKKAIQELMAKLAKERNAGGVDANES